MALTIVDRPEPRSEQELVAACIAGDAAAQRALFRREYDRVHATVYRLLGSNRDCDDLVQETFVAAFRGLARFRGDAKLSTWIDRIAVRVVFAYIRARRGAPISLDVVGEVEAGGGPAEDRAQAREGLRRLYAALAELPAEARVAFALYAIDGRTVPEVAALIGTTVVTAKLRIWRARRRLHARVAHDPILGELVREVKS
ncbi:MAG TPA: sigma-70 family RNA polymerase sigma factor [Kofleriaceae bacterium]